MMQTNRKTGKERKLRRVPWSDAAAPLLTDKKQHVTSTTMERTDSNLGAKDQEKIAEAARHGLASVDLEVQHQISAWYTVDLQKMMQTNRKTGKERNIRKRRLSDPDDE